MPDENNTETTETTTVEETERTEIPATEVHREEKRTTGEPVVIEETTVVSDTVEK